MKKLLLALIVITCVFLFNCEKENTPPTIQNTSSSPQEIKTGESAQVTCVATDPDGDNLSYTWTSAKGTFPNGSGSNSVAWKAPDEPGIYTVSVTVSDGVSTASGSVSITVEANPQLVVSPVEIDFGLEETQKTFEIKNSGTGTLSWAISEEISWLTVDKKSGDTSSENDLITLYADRDGLTPGEYSQSVTITSDGGNQVVNVSIEVEAQPTLSVTPANLDFGDSETQKTFNISNSGDGTLSWEISENIGWLTLNKTSGSTTTETEQVVVIVNRDGLDPGSYSGIISVSSDGGSQNISVAINVQEEPALAVSPSSLEFGTSETQLTFSISNSGTGTLTWEISENISWLNLNKTSGNTTSETDQISATVNRSGLSPGNYNGVISISSNGGSQDISVAIEIPEEPTLSVTLANLEFGTSENQLSFSISNSGTGNLTWNISEEISWLSLNKTSGSTTTETDQVSASVNRSGLEPGSYNGMISISSNGGSQKIIVTMEIPEEPTLSVSPTNLEFGTSETQLSFSISNSGTGTLNWNISENISWLSLDKNSGSTTTETDRVSVTVNRSGLEPGNYNGTISISSNWGNQEISVTMEIPEEPTLSVSPTNLEFGTSETQLTFSISNSGTGTLTWNISENLSWLTLNKSSGSTTTETDQVFVTVNRAGLDPGSYSGNISISSNGGNTTISVTTEIAIFSSVEGYVYYSGTTIPVSGVTVQIDESAYTTDDAGYFLLTEISLGNKQLYASKNNYDTYTRIISVKEGNNAYNIEMTSDIYTHNVYGNVKDDEGNPLQGVTVTLLNPDNSNSLLSTSSDATGYYQLPSVPQGSRHIDFSPDRIYFYDKFEADIFITNSDYPYNAVLNRRFGEFTDSRDGNSYKWQKIGNQVWMAENLAYLPIVQSCNVKSKTEPFYYVYQYYGTDKDTAKLTDSYVTYGVLYNWSAAMANFQSSNTNPSGVIGVCPSGWHLPSDSEWEQLVQFVNDEKGPYNKNDDDWYGVGMHLKSRNGWNDNGNGTDDFGFSALPGGGFNHPVYDPIGYHGGWWSSTKFNNDYSWGRQLTYRNSLVIRHSKSKDAAYSVRCIKD